jgi:hypothetical protein
MLSRFTVLACRVFNYENFLSEFFWDQNSELFILQRLEDHFVELSDDNKRDEITYNIQSARCRNQHHTVRNLYQ